MIDNLGTLRGVRPLLLALACCLGIPCAESYAGLTLKTSFTTNPDVAPSSTTYGVTEAAMPVVAEGDVESAGVVISHLGTFDIVINPTPALAGNAAALAAFNRAAMQWEAFIADPIVVTINADFSPLGAGILGSTGSVVLQAPYNTIRDQLVADASDEADDAIVASMPTAAQYSTFVPTGFGLNGNLEGTKANLKAMGFVGLDGIFGTVDAQIAFSTGFSFDFDRSNGITAGQFDFEGVAAHEIGHALGFISSVDDIDVILPGTTSQIQPTVLDLFRFRDGSVTDPLTVGDFTFMPRSMVPGQPEIFDQISPGGGADSEILMSTGVDFGDGRQTSHWKDFLSLGIMDPTLAPGELAILRLNDMRAFDLIGYEVASVPEARAWLFSAVAAMVSYASVVFARRRRTS